MDARGVATRDFEAQLRALDARVVDPTFGFAGPHSLSWRFNSEAVLHAAGPRALLLQFAHPMVAQGVADHSQFRTDLFGRTVRTFSAVYKLIYGTRDEALKTARQIHRIHKRVTGTLPHDVGCWRAGDRYAANDTALLAWVWATLLDSAVFAYERFVAPFDREDLEAYYQECRTLAALFGLTPDVYPSTYVGFRRWMERRIESDEIVVSPTARDLAGVFLSGQTGFRPLAPIFSLLASGTLPPKLRSQFGLRWDLPTRVAYRALETTITVATHAMPRVLRSMPVATRAKWRCRQRDSTQLHF